MHYTAHDKLVNVIAMTKKHNLIFVTTIQFFKLNGADP